jgi:hypothetical protein
MRFPGARKLAAIAVPFTLAAGALVFTAIPAQAIQNCTLNQTLLTEAQIAENDGDGWVYAEEELIDEGDYYDANIAYIKAGIAFKQADALFAAACA